MRSIYVNFLVVNYDMNKIAYNLEQLPEYWQHCHWACKVTEQGGGSFLIFRSIFSPNISNSEYFRFECEILVFGRSDTQAGMSSSLCEMHNLNSGRRWYELNSSSYRH